IHIRKFNDLKKIANTGYRVFFHFEEYYSDREKQIKLYKNKELFLEKEKKLFKKCFQEVTRFFFIANGSLYHEDRSYYEDCSYSLDIGSSSDEDVSCDEDFSYYDILKSVNWKNLETLGMINTGTVKGQGELYSCDNIFLSRVERNNAIKSLYIREDYLPCDNMSQFFGCIISTLYGIMISYLPRLKKIYVYIKKTKWDYFENEKLDKKILSFWMKNIEIIYNKDGEIEKIKFVMKAYRYHGNMEIIPLFFSE
ncbi:MAG: hypothetical protein AMS24_00985, partial [Chlamydiae bacterium SM23_39]